MVDQVTSKYASVQIYYGTLFIKQFSLRTEHPIRLFNTILLAILLFQSTER